MEYFKLNNQNGITASLTSLVSTNSNAASVKYVPISIFLSNTSQKDNDVNEIVIGKSNHKNTLPLGGSALLVALTSQYFTTYKPRIVAQQKAFFRLK